MVITSERQLRCWPRMSSYEASGIWAALRTDSLHRIANGIDVAAVQGDYYPLARKRAGIEDLLGLRAVILRVASTFGYPSQVRGRALIEFDQALGAAVYQQMRIMPADAANADVWTFVNTVIAPDIVLWRYGKFDELGGRWLVSEDRLYDMTRTTVGRLWWRAHLLGDAVSTQLNEDEAVSLLEKPSIGGYPGLSRALGERHLYYAKVAANTRRMDLLRDVTKRLIRVMAVRSVFFMDQEQILEFVDELFLESAQALGTSLDPVPVLEPSGSRIRSEMDWPIL